MYALREDVCSSFTSHSEFSRRTGSGLRGSTGKKIESQVSDRHVPPVDPSTNLEILTWGVFNLVLESLSPKVRGSTPEYTSVPVSE